MKVGFYMKFLQLEAAEIFAECLKSQSVQMIKKGLRPMTWKVQIGFDGDDFIMNYYTVHYTAPVVKIPRFVRNYLLRKVYKVRKIKY